jgi:hypothetical protein
MVALPTEVRRSGREVRGAFEAVFQAMVGALERGMTDRRRAQLSRAPAIAALCIGGLVIARAMRSETVADELRESCMAVALELGGWKKKQTRKIALR